MPIESGDIKLLASKVMDDVPNGGGGPTGTAIPDGASNAIFGDVTERQRAGGGVSLRQLFLAVQTGDTDAYMDPSIIVSKMPNDANISVTLAKTSMFAQRTEIANAIENYLIQGPEWSGYLLENHVAGQSRIQLFQRPGSPTPPIGRTLVLIANEGLPGEVRQFIRVTRVTVEQRIFTHSSGGGFVDYLADVVMCDLTDTLRTAFAGSPPDRSFARIPVRTVVRDTTVADAATFYGASPLVSLAALGDTVLKVSSVYSQLVPSARTETVALDQRPASQRAIVLAEAPRRVEVGVAPHTQRIKVGQENRGFSFTAMLKPLPEPGTVVISYMALGNWYTVSDDGAGAFTGSGSGQVLYTTGSVSITFPSMPDVGSSVIIQWGERVGFTNRSGQGASVRPPEYTWMLEEPGVIPGSIVVTWYSAGVLRTATDDGAGKFTGDGAGVIDYPSNTVLLRPAHLPDAGAELHIDYTTDEVHTETFAASAPDAGGFVSLDFAQQPAAGSLALTWATVRTVSNTSGATESRTSAVKKANVTYTTRSVPEAYEPSAPASGSAGGAQVDVLPPSAPPINWPRSS